MSTEKMFHGYNCYSAAIGEYCNNKLNSGIHDLILSQWSFYFDKSMMLNGQWFTGAADGPVDLLLYKDLNRFCSLIVEEHRLNGESILSEIQELLRLENQLIILVDFYYLESVQWEHLKRFGVERVHDPHFIIINEIDQDGVTFIDPYYNFRGQMSLDILKKAQNSITRQGGIEYRYYLVKNIVQKDIDLREVIKFRFMRYMEEKQYMAIAEFGQELINNADYILKQKSFAWAIDTCFCLKSTSDQHMNLNETAFQNSIELPSQLLDLENEWALIRKSIYSMFLKRKVALSNIQVISEQLCCLAEKEKYFAQQAIAML